MTENTEASDWLSELNKRKGKKENSLMDFGVVINYYFLFFNVVSHGYESNLIGAVNVFVIRTNDIF